MEDKNLNLEIYNLNNQIKDLYVLIDTLQTNLRSAVSYLKDGEKDKVVNVQSYKWCMNWKQGDEKNGA